MFPSRSVVSAASAGPDASLSTSTNAVVPDPTVARYNVPNQRAPIGGWKVWEPIPFPARWWWDGLDYEEEDADVPAVKALMLPKSEQPVARPSSSRAQDADPWRRPSSHASATASCPAPSSAQRGASTGRNNAPRAARPAFESRYQPPQRRRSSLDDAPAPAGRRQRDQRPASGAGQARTPAAAPGAVHLAVSTALAAVAQQAKHQAKQHVRSAAVAARTAVACRA